MKSWTEILLDTDDTLEKTIKVLQYGGKRIALVVDKNRKLLGTVTDGDIRRGLLNNATMQSPVKAFMNSSPYSASISDSSSFISSIMKNKDLLSIPLVDENGILIGLKTFQDILEKINYSNTVFLLAGGFGKRLHPLTEKKPKPLLKVGNSPILETIINQFIEAGFQNFYLSTHYKANMIQDYLAMDLNGMLILIT